MMFVLDLKIDVKFANVLEVRQYSSQPRSQYFGSVTKIKNTNTGTKTNTVRENTKQQITGSTHARHLGDITKSATRRYGYKHTDTSWVINMLDDPGNSMPVDVTGAL